MGYRAKKVNFFIQTQMLLLLKLPQLLGLDYDSAVAPKLDALQQRLGCDEAALAAEVLRILRTPLSTALALTPTQPPTLTRCCAILRPRPSRYGVRTSGAVRLT